MAKGEGQLPESVRAEIVTQLLSGGKFAVISRECNVNRKTVQGIADKIGIERPKRQFTAPSVSSKPKRCSECGGMVYMPCLLCRIKKQNESEKGKI